MSTKKYQVPKRPVTPADKTFIKLVSQGINRAKAYRMSYPEHPTVQRYIDAVKKQDTDARATERKRVIALAKDKIQTKHIQSAMETYNKKMETFAEKSLETAIDLVENARSEKVRADLAIEGIRHKVGTPVQKVQVQQEKNVYLSFSDPAARDDLDDIIEGEVVE